jgi:hypothetical protein
VLQRPLGAHARTCPGALCPELSFASSELVRGMNESVSKGIDSQPSPSCCSFIVVFPVHPPRKAFPFRPGSWWLCPDKLVYLLGIIAVPGSSPHSPLYLAQWRTKAPCLVRPSACGSVPEAAPSAGGERSAAYIPKEARCAWSADFTR